MPIFAHVPLLQRLTGLIYFPINHAFPHFGLAAGADVPAGQVPDPLPRADRHVALRARGRRRHRARRAGSPSGSGCASRRSWTTSYWRANPSGSVKFPAWGRGGFEPAPGWRSRVVLLAGCGGDDFKNEARAPIRLELTGVIQDDEVTVSPAKLGAGPVAITISNQTDVAHSITLEGASTIDHAGPVQPGDTATIQKTLEPGSYEVKAGSEKAVKRGDPAGRAADRQVAQELEQRRAAALELQLVVGRRRRRLVGRPHERVDLLQERRGRARPCPRRSRRPSRCWSSRR